MNISKYIDHTILKSNATKAEVKQLCEEAKVHGFASVCVNQYYIQYVSQQLKGSDVKVCSVVGFPLGAVVKEVKAFETSEAVENGADEVDMVINIGALKDGLYDVVLEDIQAVVAAAQNAIVKVIIETCLLTDEQKVKACELAVEAGAHFVKTSTGFSISGATLEDIRLMKQTVGENALVKASGGIRDYETALAFIVAGADRIGTSAGVSIVNHENQKSNGSY